MRDPVAAGISLAVWCVHVVTVVVTAARAQAPPLAPSVVTTTTSTASELTVVALPRGNGAAGTGKNDLAEIATELDEYFLKAADAAVAAARGKRRGADAGEGADPAAEAAELVRFFLRKTSGGKERMVSVLDRHVKVVRTEHCFLLFEELGRHDGWVECLEIFRWMQKQRWYVADNGIYSKLISVMGRKGQIRMAMWLFSQMRNSGCKPDTSVYNALIGAHLHSRDKSKALVKALGYFDKMKGIERCQPNIVTYNILLRACARASDTKQVDILFKDLDESPVSPDIYTYNGVIDGYGKNGMIKEMESVLVRMKSKQCRPDVITFNILIDSYGRKQTFDKMEQVFKSLLRSKERPTHPTFNSMITNYGKARLREKAESVLEKMEELGFKPNYVTQECLITLYAYCDCVSKAQQIFDELVRSQSTVPISSLNAMLDAYCMNRLPMEADRLFDTAIEKGVVPSASTYKLLYKAYTRANDKMLVQKLLQRMNKQGIVPNKKFFLDALEAFGNSANKPRRVRTSDTAREPSRESASNSEMANSSKTKLSCSEAVDAFTRILPNSNSASKANTGCEINSETATSSEPQLSFSQVAS